MAKNVFNATTSEPKQAPAKRKSLEFKFLKWLKIPEINKVLLFRCLYVFGIFACIIMVRHNYISILRQIDNSKKERNGSRAIYLNLKAKHEVQQRQSEVVKQLEVLSSEVSLTKEPPTKIMVKKN